MQVLSNSRGNGPCGTHSAALPRPKPITVNGVVLGRAAIAREVQNHPAGKPVEAWTSAARALVVREMLLQEAQRLGMTPEPLVDDEGRRETDDEALVRAVVEREVIIPTADEATCLRYFEQNRQKFHSPDLFAVRHILCAAAPWDAEARTAARQLAEGIIEVLTRDPKAFAALAQAHSACPSRTVGGSLGQVTNGQTVPEFEEALATLPIGRVFERPLETRYGIHVVILDARSEGTPLPFDLVKKRIAAWLTERAYNAAIHQFVAMLAGRATITGIELETA